MFICKCGKEYKTERGFIKHQTTCEYTDIDLDKIYNLGFMINDVDKKMFHIYLNQINKYSKNNNLTIEESRKELQKAAIYKYRKSLWDILTVWKTELLVSEYRHFLRWIWKTYKEITLISLRNILSNPKIIYRYNLENTVQMIGKRIDESLIYIHEHGVFSNDFEFVDIVSRGHISVYYILFNDWLATKWFGRLDMDLQRELEYFVEIASKIILDRVKSDEFELLQQLACTNTPNIHRMD